MLDSIDDRVPLREAMYAPPPRDEGRGPDPTLHAVCVHEAGHAVAAVLAGRRIRDVVVLSAGRGMTAGGQSRPHFDLEVGGNLTAGYLLRGIVQTYAGPVAELRFNPAFEFDGCGDDLDSNELYAGLLHEMTVNGVSDGDEILRRVQAAGRTRLDSRRPFLVPAWQQACAMFLDERVWQVTMKVADYLHRRAPAARLRIEGDKVARWVREGIPEGWKWDEPFGSP